LGLETYVFLFHVTQVSGTHTVFHSVFPKNTGTHPVKANFHVPPARRFPDFHDPWQNGFLPISPVMWWGRRDLNSRLLASQLTSFEDASAPGSPRLGRRSGILLATSSLSRPSCPDASSRLKRSHPLDDGPTRILRRSDPIFSFPVLARFISQASPTPSSNLHEDAPS